MNFADKVVLITGGSSGIGADAARYFAKLKANVVIVGRNEKRLSKVADRIAADGSTKPHQIVADVSIDSERIISETVASFGRLDVLVNNAGIFKGDSVDDFDVNNFDNVINVNLRSAVVLSHLAVPHLEKTKGNIVNVSSIVSIKSLATCSTSYSISKAGLDQFTKCAALVLAAKGIRVNGVNPGVIRTNIYDSLGVNDSNADDYFEAVGKSCTLVGRIGKVADTSAAIGYLASETFVNGISLIVDGGYHCADCHDSVLLQNMAME